MRATYFNGILAVSSILLTILCTTVPVWADVIITAAQVGDTNEVIISFDATSETNLVRAFALDIRLDNDANIVSVTGISPDYYIYPGTIQIDSFGNVIDYGTALAEYGDLPGGTLPGLDSNGITIEMASLYAPVGPGSPNAPAKSGDLLLFSISDYTCITITPNLARAGPTGVVMEDPNEIIDVNYPERYCIDSHPPHVCMKESAPEYSVWQDWGEPKCWCYARQCRGDIDGIISGPFWVAVPDLNLFRPAFNKMDAQLALVENGICADLDHLKSGPFRVAVPDLNIFRLYFNKMAPLVPECDPTNFNWWETP